MPLAGRSRAAAHVEHSEIVCIVSREELEEVVSDERETGGGSCLP